MTKRSIGVSLAWIAVATCTANSSGDVHAPLRNISFETGACLGAACPVYRVTVEADGSGIFEGRHWTAITGVHRFSATPQQFQAFARHLAPIRPASGAIRHAGEACRSMMADMPSAEVTWRGEDGGEQQLYLYYGCDMEAHRTLAERLTAAPRLLPITDLIGPSR